MDYTIYLGIVAGVLQLIGYVLYRKEVFRGSSTPDATAWTLWTFLSILGVSSYASMTGDFAKYFLPLSSAVGNAAIFCYSLSTRKFERIGYWDWPVLILGILGGIVWWWYQSATYANLISIGAESIAFIPVYRTLWSNPRRQKPLPWLIWTIAFAVNALVVMLRWNNHWQDMVNPIAMFIMHSAVVFLALRKTPMPTRS